MKQIFYVVAFSFVILACGKFPNGNTQSEKISEKRNSVYEPDARQGAEAWLPVGRLRGGTAFAVGPHTIMTAAHCVHNLSSDAKFEMQNGKTFKIKNIVAQGAKISTRNVNATEMAKDWAILNVEGALAKYFRLSSFPISSAETLQLAGYSQDRVGLTVDSKCRFRGLWETLMYHDCGMTPGASGGPIFSRRKDSDHSDDYYVVAVQSAQVCPRDDGNCLFSNWTAETSNFGAVITSEIIDVVKREMLR